VTYRERAPIFDPEASPKTFKAITIDKGDLEEGSPPPTWSSRANTERGIRSSSTSSRTA
jgi:hypothetical protein